MHPEQTGTLPYRAWLFCLGALLMYACASPSRTITHTEITDPADLIQRIHARSGRIQDARVRAHVSMQIDGVRQNASSVIFVRRPTDLRLEVNGTLGVNIMSARFWEDSVRVYLPSENGYLEGDAARVLYHVTGMDLSYYELDRVLLGLPSIQPSDRDHLTGFSTDRKAYTIDTRIPGGLRRTWVDRAELVVTREDVLDRWGETQSSLRLSSYKTVSESSLPRKITIRQGLTQIALSVESHRLNEGLEDSVFDQALPPSALPLDSGQ